MHVGYGVFFQNPGHRLTDQQVYAQELRLAKLAEPLGFDSVWSTEHHFTDYLISPDVMQFLSYMAACTERVYLGSMVVVLPWHDPIRVAEQVSMLDTLCGGRMILGLGRGLGRVEFEGFRVNMSDSREMFSEYSALLLQALETGVAEYQGQFVQQPRREIRPAPFKPFGPRTYAATMSPDSMPVLARHGLGILVIPQKPWRDVEKDFALYNATFREANGRDAPPPLASSFMLVDENADRAAELAHRYIGAYYHSVMEHYELTAGHLAHTKGYDFYHRVGQHIERQGADKVAAEFVELMPYGTPEQVLDKVRFIHERIGNAGMTGMFSYGGMPHEVAEGSLRLFAREVLPELQRFRCATPSFALSA